MLSELSPRGGNWVAGKAPGIKVYVCVYEYTCVHMYYM